MIFFIFFSTLTFCAQTLPEIQDRGEDSYQCEKVIEKYCSNKYDQNLDPACFVYPKLESTDDSSGYKRLKFWCDDDDCFGEGLNFGKVSPNSINESSLTCNNMPRPFQVVFLFFSL